MTSSSCGRICTCRSTRWANQNLIDEFNAQTTLLGKVDKDLRDQLQRVLQNIAAAKAAIHKSEAEREAASRECSRFVLYFRLLKEWLKVG